MIENSILRKNRQGLKALVLGLTFPCTEAIEYAARASFDAVNLDGEHGAFSPDSVDLVCRVAHGYGMSVTARVPSIDAWVINCVWIGASRAFSAPRGERCRRPAVGGRLPASTRRSALLGRWSRHRVQRRTPAEREVQWQAGLRPVDQPEHDCAGPDRVEASA